MDYKELILQYADSLRTDLTWASKTHINMLTMLAAENKAAAASICAAIERHILSVKPFHLRSSFILAATCFPGPLFSKLGVAIAGASSKQAADVVSGRQHRQKRQRTLYRPLLPQPCTGTLD